MDGAVIAQLGTPDMKLPIQYAFYYPERRYLEADRLDFSKITSIAIEKPDYETFLGIPLAKKASRIGGTMPTVMNEANEVAVAAFLSGKIHFLDIYEIYQLK
jgi:1-deoxy-D-xylulose-5-phosphate reductoisomerase